MSETVFRHAPEMGEISGFGGSYEKCCQDMLESGVKHLIKQDNILLQGHAFKNIYGIFRADSEDAKELERVILCAAKGEATGAMHQAVMTRLFWISRHGWDKYVEKHMNHSGENGEA